MKVVVCMKHILDPELPPSSFEIEPEEKQAKIGKHAFIGGLFRVSQDVPPFIMAVGDPLKYGGVNSIGLRRRGFSSKERINIKRAYRIYFKSELRPAEALKKIKTEFQKDKNILSILNFIENSNRGII